MPRLFYLLLIILQIPAFGVVAQGSGKNTLFGTVEMPPPHKQGVITRGEAYRNRSGRTGAEAVEVDPDNLPDRNVIVIFYPLDFAPRLTPAPGAEIRQRNKEFIPHVLPVVRGSTVVFVNDDEFYHNVFSITPQSKFNVGRRPPGHRYERLIDKAGEVRLFCDIHPQMNATILSLETPYFTRVDAAGRYRMEGLPPGRYRVEVYHPEAGVLTSELTIADAGEQRQDFSFLKKPIQP